MLKAMKSYAKYKKLHAYDEASKLKEEGKIKHFEISFHDNADVLDMILTENPVWSSSNSI